MLATKDVLSVHSPTTQALLNLCSLGKLIVNSFPQMLLVFENVSWPAMDASVSHLPDLFRHLTYESEIMTHKDQAAIPVCTAEAAT